MKENVSLDNEYHMRPISSVVSSAVPTTALPALSSSSPRTSTYSSPRSSVVTDPTTTPASRTNTDDHMTYDHMTTNSQGGVIRIYSSSDIVVRYIKCYEKHFNQIISGFKNILELSVCDISTISCYLSCD